MSCSFCEERLFIIMKVNLAVTYETLCFNLFAAAEPSANVSLLMELYAMIPVSHFVANFIPVNFGVPCRRQISISSKFWLQM